MARDYYQILGVSETTGKDEIKRKYRELAKKYHPDRNKGNKEAEEKFKEISEAYHVLNDDQKRRQYDSMRRFGGFDGGVRGGPGGGRFYTEADFSQTFGNGFRFDDLFGFGGLGDIFSSMFSDNVRTRRRQKAGPAKGKDIRAELTITPEQSLRGVTKKIKLAVPTPCAECAGEGTVAGSGQSICPRCQGTGQTTHVQGNFSISRPCPSCLGQGVIPGQTCRVCGGLGVVKPKKTVAVKIPAGIEDGGTVRLRGLGYPGQQGGPNGDLIIEVKIMADQKFNREGNDIHTTVNVTFPQAALGAKVPVQALAKKVMLAIKPGTQPGSILRLKGLGLAVGEQAGDLLVTVHVTVPTSLTERQKELLREFEETTA
jgi:molecular chaperone DnaJ